MRPLFFAALVALSGCGVAIHQVQPGGFSPYVNLKDHSVVQASAEQHVIFGFNDDTDYVDLCWDGLKRKCPRGNLTGVTVETSTKLGFFNWTNRVVMRGICAEPPPPPEPDYLLDEEGEPFLDEEGNKLLLADYQVDEEGKAVLDKDGAPVPVEVDEEEAKEK